MVSLKTEKCILVSTVGAELTVSWRQTGKENQENLMTLHTKSLTVRGLPAALLASLRLCADENERTITGEIRYALKLHARAGWRIHGKAIAGCDELLTGQAIAPPVVLRSVDCLVIRTLRQYATWNVCKLRDEVIHALARYVDVCDGRGRRMSLDADELSAQALVEAIQQRSFDRVRSSVVAVDAGLSRRADKVVIHPVRASSGA